jgi:hypothetical protein
MEPERKKVVKEKKSVSALSDESLQGFVERTKKLLAREHKEEVELLETQLKSLSNKVLF